MNQSSDSQSLDSDKNNNHHVDYFHTDINGAALDLTASDGDILWCGKYQAWGKLKPPIRINPDQLNHSEQPLRFAGQYADDETGLYYNTFRYYNPETGRFTTQDPIGLAGGINLYQYAPNPFGWMDPLGLECTAKDAQKKINKDQGPREIVRIDSPDLQNVPGSQWHAHDRYGGALNLNGTAHDAMTNFSKKTLKWLQEYGWKGNN